MADEAFIAELIAELTGDESKRLFVYDDATGLPLKPGMVCHGHPSIGVGRALDVHGLSDDEVTYLLRNDATRVAGELTAEFSWFGALTNARKCVLASMSFNLGNRGLLGFHDTLTLVAKGDYLGASLQMADSDWAKQVGDRAKRLCRQMLSGKPVAR